MNEDIFSMVQECTSKYSIEDLDEKEVEIRIRLPKKFKYLWLSKLSGLKTSKNEIDEFEEA